MIVHIIPTFTFRSRVRYSIATNIAPKRRYSGATWNPKSASSSECDSRLSYTTHYSILYPLVILSTSTFLHPSTAWCHIISKHHSPEDDTKTLEEIWKVRSAQNRILNPTVPENPSKIRQTNDFFPTQAKPYLQANHSCSCTAHSGDNHLSRTLPTSTTSLSRWSQRFPRHKQDGVHN